MKKLVTAVLLAMLLTSCTSLSVLEKATANIVIEQAYKKQQDQGRGER